MEKICPRCGARFPALAAFCDLDGAGLINVPRARPRRRGRSIVLAVVALLCLTAGAAVPRFVEHYLRLKIGVVLEKVRYPATGPGLEAPNTLGGLIDRIAGLADMLTGSDEIALSLRVRNNTPLKVSLVSTTYAITVDGVAAASGIWAPEQEPIYFAPGDEITADIGVRPSAEAVAAIGRDLLQGRRPAVRISGHLTVEVLWTTFTLPFEVEELQIDLRSPGRLPEPAAPDSEGLEVGPRQVV